MKYLKAYLEAFAAFTFVLGGLYLAGSWIFSISLVAHYFLFLTIIGALGGPIGVAIGKKQYEKSMASPTVTSK